MLSRRNIRVKVMQCLYAWHATEGFTEEEVLRMYDKDIASAYDLLIYQLYLLTKVSEHAIEDQKKRQAKLLPGEYDKIFTPKLYFNPLITALTNNKELNRLWKKFGFDQSVNEDFTKKLYKTFALSEEYVKYINQPNTIEEDRAILLHLYKELTKHEFFNETVEDHFFNWCDDESIVIGTMKKIIKALPVCNDLMEEHGPSKETVEDFGKAMLSYIVKNNTQLESLVGPLIENWNLDRVAVIDMILIKMSVTEMLIFPSIPTKVSINEYLELTKNYSTDKSKEFVNGILDKALHTLVDKDQIKKSGRGLVS